MVCGCSPNVYTYRYERLPATQIDSVVVLGEDDSVPEGIDTVGRIKIGNTGFTADTSGTLSAVMSIARRKAAAMGGNVLKITELLPPNWNSSIYTLEANILHLDSAGMLSSRVDEYSSDEVVLPASPAPVWRSHIIGGVGYRINPVDYSIPEISRRALYYYKWGVSYGAGITRYNRNGAGFGLNVRGHFSNGRYSANVVNILFIGPTYSERFFSRNNRHCFISEFGMGYLQWRNYNGYKDISNTGWSIGRSYGIAYEYSFTRHLALCLDMSLIAGYITRYTEKNEKIKYNTHQYERVVELPKDHYEGVYHLDLSLGLRMQLF